MLQSVLKPACPARKLLNNTQRIEYAKTADTHTHAHTHTHSPPVTSVAMCVCVWGGGIMTVGENEGMERQRVHFTVLVCGSSTIEACEFEALWSFYAPVQC